MCATFQLGFVIYIAYQIGLYLFLLSKIVGDYKEALPRLNNDWLMVSNFGYTCNFCRLTKYNFITKYFRLEV